MILFYSVGSNPIWNDVREGYTSDEIIKRFPKID